MEGIKKNRDFICSCNKSYLSYAALFTHIKQKHGGKAPGKVIKPKSENKRGRPRKNADFPNYCKSQTLLDNGILNNEYNDNINKNIRQINSSPKIQGFQNYKAQNDESNEKKIPVEYKLLSEDQLTNKTQNYIDHCPQIHRQYFSTTNFIYDWYSLKNTLESSTNIEDLDDEQLKNMSAYNELKNCQKLNINGSNGLGIGLCQFLNFAKEYLKQKQYHQILLMTILLYQNVLNNQCHFNTQCGALQTLTKNLDSFFTTFLPSKQKEYQEWCLQQFNPINIVVCLLDWMVLIEVKQNNFTEGKMKMSSVQTTDDNHSKQMNDANLHCSLEAQINQPKQADLYPQKCTDITLNMDQISTPEKQISQSSYYDFIRNIKVSSD